jgi:predicted nuclease with TOPRIM domain
MSLESKNAALRAENEKLVALNDRLNATIGRVVEQRDALTSENGMLKDALDGCRAACDELRRELRRLELASGHEMRGMVVNPGAMG